jgi:hypothetical protein
MNMSWIVTEIPVEELFSDGSDAVLSVVLETHSCIVSVNVGEHMDQLRKVAEFGDVQFG